MKIHLLKILGLFLFLTLSLQLSIFSDVIKNLEWDDQVYRFPMEKIWSIEGGSEDDPFGFIMQVLVTDSGNVFCRDLKNKRYYAFSRDGKFLRHFGKFGEGPGEVQNTGGAKIYGFKNSVMVQDSSKILYFNDKGQFKKSVPHLGKIRFFLSEDEVIVSPLSILNLPNENAKIRLINLKTKKEKTIARFNVFKSGVINSDDISASIVIPSITPVMVVGENRGKLYYGMNNNYSIDISDLDGKKSGSFTLKNKVKDVNFKEKVGFILRLLRGLAPKSLAKILAKTLPDQETHFSRIHFHKDLVLVYKSQFVAVNSKIIDIFTSKGRHLKRCLVEIEKGSLILSGPLFYKNFIFVALENEDGDIILRKYKTIMPVVN